MIVAIPDVHTQYEKAQKILDNWDNPANEIIFLGDYFDDFNDSVEINVQTAKWVLSKITDKNKTFLLANHDMSYFVAPARCSGWTCDKQNALDFFIKDSRTSLFQFYKLMNIAGQQTLFSHAGLHPHHLPAHFDLKNLDQFLSSQEQAAKGCMKYDDMHWFYHAGRARGGRYSYGGLTWLDWEDEFEPIEGLSQIVGHTRNWNVRKKEAKDSVNICLDTHLNNYLTIDENTGETTIYEI